MSILEKRRKESVDSMKMFIPECWDIRKDPPVSSVAAMEQLPKLLHEPKVSVGIMECERLAFAFDSDFVSQQMPDATLCGSYEVHSDGDKMVFEDRLYDVLRFDPAHVQNPYSDSGFFALSDVVIGKQFHWQQTEEQRFKGALVLSVVEGRIMVVNHIDVESYLYSVISSEMRAEAPIEFLKAHAIISRSWLLKPMFDAEGETEAVREYCSEDTVIRWYERDAHRHYDVCADDHCQRYQGIGRATTSQVAEAIEATRGVVLASGGHICDARFSKACGGVTELFENCWADTHYPYLERVVDATDTEVPDLTIEANADRWIRKRHDAWCSTSDVAVLGSVLNDYDRQTTDFYRWTVRYSTEYLSDLIRRKSGIDFGRILDLQPVRRGTSGRIVMLKVVGTKRSITVGKELEIRRWLSESHLYSSAFVVERDDEGFTLIGAGWGHGVGLCQIGAAAMASKGRNHTDILEHYFPELSLPRCIENETNKSIAMKKSSKSSPWYWIPTLYFAEGIPYVVVMTVAVVMYKRLGLSNTDIALYTSWLYLPWVIKPFWSPFVDLIRTKRWWIVSMQLLIGASLASIAVVIPAPFFVKSTLALFWLMAFSSATHDIAADGFYMLALDKEKQAFFVGIRSTFYRISMIAGQGLLVILAGWLERTTGQLRLAWSVTFGVIAVLFILFVVYHHFVLPKPAADRSLVDADFKSVLKGFLTTFVSFFRKPGMAVSIAFMLLYRLGEALLVKMSSPFMLDSRDLGGLGLSTADVGFVYGTVGVVALTVGGILGGMAVARRGLKFWMWPMALSITLPNMVYWYMAYMQPDSYLVINIAVAVEQFGYGFGFTAYMLYLIQISAGEHSTAHYALCTGFMALGMMLPGMAAGWLQEMLGYCQFFMVVVLCTVPTLAIIPFLKIDKPSVG